MAKKKDKDPNIHNIAYKYALDYKQEQSVYDYLFMSFGCRRKVYNYYVDCLYQQLEAENYTSGFIKFKAPEVSTLKKLYPFLKQAHSLALSNCKLAFESAIRNYNDEQGWTQYKKSSKKKNQTIGEPLTFRDYKSMPTFKSKKRNQNGFTINNQTPQEVKALKNDSIRLDGNLLYLPKLKQPIKLILHRQIPKDYKIKSITLSTGTDGKLFCSILLEYYKEIKPIEPKRFCGLDYAQKDFYVSSTGEKANPPKAYKKSQKHLAKLQKKLAKKQKGSKNWMKAKQKVARLNTKIAHQRLDFAHKKSYHLAKDFDLIAVEDIDLRNMAQCLQLGKNLHDNGFGMFRLFLEYKLKQQGKHLVKVDKWYPSSKTCHKCGSVNHELQLSDRTYHCSVCGLTFDRDHNAAINIMKQGKKVFTNLQLA